MLGDVGGGLLEIQAGRKQVRTVSQRHQLGAYVVPIPDYRFPYTPDCHDRIAEEVPPHVPEELFVLEFPHLGTVGDRCKPSRFNEADLFWRDGDANFMAPAQQFAAHRGRRLYVAARAITCQGKLQGASFSPLPYVGDEEDAIEVRPRERPLSRHFWPPNGSWLRVISSYASLRHRSSGQYFT